MTLSSDDESGKKKVKKEKKERVSDDDLEIVAGNWVRGSHYAIILIVS